MPTRDLFHNTVRTALEKDGWTITDDPLRIQVNNENYYIDLGAEKILAAEKEGERIAVEVKSFVGHSAITNFYSALGQLLIYTIALNEQEPERVIYLAFPDVTWRTFFQRKVIQKAIKLHHIKIITINDIKQEITQWIK